MLSLRWSHSAATGSGPATNEPCPSEMVSNVASRRPSADKYVIDRSFQLLRLKTAINNVIMIGVGSDRTPW
jgi:hypothetical protein